MYSLIKQGEKKKKMMVGKRKKREKEKTIPGSFFSVPSNGCLPSLTVRLLVTSTGTRTSELLGFTTTGISNEESTVVLDEDFLDFLLGSFINELLVESNDGLSKSLTDSVDLRSVTTTVNSDSDVNVGETFFTQKEDNFVDLELQDLGFEEFNGRTVDTDETTTTLTVGDGSSGFLL